MNGSHPLNMEQNIVIDYMELDEIIEEEFYNDKENLIMILQAIQRKFNYLPHPTLTYLSEKIQVPLVEIYGMATFYSNFSLEPRGKNIVSICLGTACHVRGGERVREKIEGTLDICDGETSQDMSFSLESVRCIGCCSLGPVIKVNDDIHARISSEDVENILNNYE
ncbi:MAG: NAD(P)H-dependent oxidoreductase subunit E [Desulfobacterales bacterium]